jgi:asparagine synthase (glutamine-hydrolysing)
MCGIGGTFGLKYLSNEYIKAIIQHQHNRGPDDYHYTYPVKGGWLGHNRLSIIDLSKKGNQPMNFNRYALTYNGEIYNYRALQSYLYANDDLGNCPNGNDAWTLGKYIEKFGIERAIQDANGMYAYCCFDAELQQIHLVVDRFGQKPLYYYHSGASFAFASSVGALMQLRDKWEIDPDGLQSYWLLGSTMGENSMIKAIKRLTGSHHLTYDIRANTIKIERYWTPKFQDNTSGIEDLVLDAINKVRVSDVPVYTFLSGGIDSTLVASQCEGMNAVHLDGPEVDYAREAARKFRMNLYVVNPQMR